MTHKFYRSHSLSKRPEAVFVVVLVCALVGGLNVAPTMAVSEVTIPPVLFATLPHVDNTYPIWVSAEAAISAEGELIAELFHPHLHSRLRSYLQTPPDPAKGCIPVAKLIGDPINPPDRSHLGGAIEHSSVVLLGEVVARDFGFERGLPGQLLAVRPLRTYKGDTRLDHYYFFMPVGRFSAGPYTFCKTDNRYPDPPELGDQVLIMAPTREETGPYLNIEDANSLIVFDEKSEGRYSWQLRLDPGDVGATPGSRRPQISREDILRRIEELAREGSGQ